MSRNENLNVRRLTESAILVAIAFVLNFVSSIIPNMPQGGSVTLASLVPLLIISYRHGWKWGTFSAFVFALLKVMLSNNFAWIPVQNFQSFAAVALLDYIVAFSVLGLADLFRKPFGGKKYIGYSVSCVIVMFLRFICHFLSGVLIWYPFAEAAGFDNRWLFSMIYNGGYMLPETIITTVVLVLLARTMKFEKA